MPIVVLDDVDVEVDIFRLYTDPRNLLEEINPANCDEKTAGPQVQITMLPNQSLDSIWESLVPEVLVTQFINLLWIGLFLKTRFPPGY